MESNRSNILHIKNGSFLKERITKGSILRLLVQKQGIEIIHNEIKDGHYWAVGPIDEWEGIEFIYLLSGSLSWVEGHEQKIASEGDHLIMDPVLVDTLFTANGDTSFLYVSCSLSQQSTFDLYDEQIKEFRELAVAVEEKDGYTAEHCHRITDLSVKVGKKLNLSSDEIYGLHIGAFFHDVGKIHVPDNILNKPGKLTNEEYEIIKKHATSGAELLTNSGIPFLIDSAFIVEQHHERYNGSGYPHGLKGDEIPLPSAIVGVVDSFDAMTSDRIYSKGRSVEDALGEIKRESGRLYHPLVVEAFLSVMKKEG